MNTSHQPNPRANAVREYLAAIGHPISTVQSYEVVARACGFKHRHAMAGVATRAEGVPAYVHLEGKSIPVMPVEGPALSADAMRKLDWVFDHVVAIPLSVYGAGIEAANDWVSERLTGSEVALEDITYSHMPEVNYGKDMVAFRVTGLVSSPEELLDEDEPQFYRNLQELLSQLNDGVAVEILAGSSFKPFNGRLALRNQLALEDLRAYAVSQGANNERINAIESTLVFDIEGPSRGFVLTVDMLKYATKFKGPRAIDHWTIVGVGTAFLLKVLGTPRA